MSKPSVTLYTHRGPGPNPYKVSFLLEALGVSYECVGLEFGDDPEKGVKSQKYLNICPNGRVPAIVDHDNNDLVVWESGAILYYLCEKYDKEGKFFGKTIEEKTEVMVWLTFQLSGLGPAQGQVNWFLHLHEKSTGEAAGDSIHKRYRDECDRLFKVLEKRLGEQENKGGFVALDRLTIADLAFHSWLRIAYFAKINFDGYPKLQAYVDKLEAMDIVKNASAKMPQ